MGKDFRGMSMTNKTTTNIEIPIEAPDKNNAQTGYLYGWICPRCGRVLSPYTSVCMCKLTNTPPIYCQSRGSDWTYLAIN